MNTNGKPIVDVCCGCRMFYFDKNDTRVLFCDRRVMNPTAMGRGKNVRIRSCQPDVTCDFTSLPFDDGSYSVVVFDPPHLVNAGKTGWLRS